MDHYIDLVLGLGFDFSGDMPIKEVAKKKKNIRMVDLLSGTGAFTHAFEKTGKASCVFSNDVYLSSKTIYDMNFNRPLTLCPIQHLSPSMIPKHDILTTIFPSEKDSLEIFMKIMKLIDAHQTSVLIFECETNFILKGNMFQIFKEELESRLYYIHSKRLNISKMGIPQYRDRLYLVALRSKEMFDKFSLDFPKVELLSPAYFIETNVSSRFYMNNSKHYEDLKELVVKKDTFYQYTKGQTLPENMARKHHKIPLILDEKGIRKMTPRECFSIQGFPSSYQLPRTMDSSLYELACHSGSVCVIQRIADRLMELF